MSITQAPNSQDPALVDMVARTRRAKYRVAGVHPDWVDRFKTMAADRVAEILRSAAPVIVVPARRRATSSAPREAPSHW